MRAYVSVRRGEILAESGRAVHRVFLSARQEAFLEGHVHAFEVLGGVPFGRIRYDNLKSAVSAVLGLSRHRVENDRWVAFRSHYSVEAFYCQLMLSMPSRSR